MHKMSVQYWEDASLRRAGGKSGYQTLINSALREYLDGKAPKIEDALRRIVREELSRNKVA
jgi:hypothetical protein